VSAAKDYRIAPAWRAMLADLGINPVDVMRTAGLAEDLMTQAEIRATAGEFFALWRATESLHPDVDLPLEFAQRTTAETFAPPIFASLCSPNLAVALDRLSTYKQLCAPVRIELDTTPEHGLKATLRWLSAAEPPPATLSMLELAFMARIARMGTRQAVNPVEVGLPEVPPNLAAYEAYFGIRLSSCPTGSITFSRDVLQLPFLTSSEEMWQAFEPTLRRRLASLESSASNRERVRAVLLESLPSGRANIGEVSHRLGVSARTLQRRLRSEESSFNAVLAEVREQLARHYLANTELPCNEIAFLLGYEEPNSFFRAFHNWTGESPERHRQAAPH
jgi:AraC-like DNA-binding protein